MIKHITNLEVTQTVVGSAVTIFGLDIGLELLRKLLRKSDIKVTECT